MLLRHSDCSVVAAFFFMKGTTIGESLDNAEG